MAYNPLNVIRRDADTVVNTDLGNGNLNLNSVGRLKVSQWPGAYDNVTGTITTATSVINVDVARSASATVVISGTYAGVNVTFEVSNDNTIWVAIPVQPISLTNTLITATGVLTANSTVAYDVSPLLGVSFFRVRATAWTSGTANVSVSRGANPVEYATQVNGAVTASIAASQTLATVTTVGTVTSVTNGVRAAVNTTAGGATTFTLVSAATTNGTLIGTAAARTLYGIQAFNNGATACYVKVYANATAPTVGTTVPVMTLMVPAGGGFVMPVPPQGFAIAAGLGIAITGGNTTADTTAVAANQVNLNVQYA